MKHLRFLSMLALLFVGCVDNESPFTPEETNVDYTIMPQLGEVRDVFIEDDIIFIATESKGVFVYELDNNGIMQLLYTNESWGDRKDMRSIHYYKDNKILVALDRFGLVYQEYLPYLLGEEDHPLGDNTDTLRAIDCNVATHATKIAANGIDEFGNPELFVLYKHNADLELYLDESYSEIKRINYDDFFLNVLNDVHITQCQDAFSVNDTLNYAINDMYNHGDNIFVANTDSSLYTYTIFNESGEFIAKDTINAEVLSIYGNDDYVFAGTRQDGCYITLLNQSGLSQNPDDKLHIAHNMSILDIHYDSTNDKLVLSCGSNGVLVYDWNNGNPIEHYRIYSSYAFTAKMLNNLILVATKNGLEVFNIEE